MGSRYFRGVQIYMDRGVQILGLGGTKKGGSKFVVMQLKLGSTHCQVGSVKAVYVSDLSTDAFIACLRRLERNIYASVE